MQATPTTAQRPTPTTPPTDDDGIFRWACHRCRRHLAEIRRLDGELRIVCKCGARNVLNGVCIEQPRE